jgi:hypothetical protein
VESQQRTEASIIAAYRASIIAIEPLPTNYGTPASNIAKTQETGTTCLPERQLAPREMVARQDVDNFGAFRRIKPGKAEE